MFNRKFWVVLALAVVQGMLAMPSGAAGSAATYMDSQVFSRRAYGFGMYVIQGFGNIDNQPVVVGYYLQSLQPSIEWQPAGAYLWHWTELDFEFVPQTISPQREHVICDAPFPKGNCKNWRSKAFTDATAVEGMWTDDLIAAAIRKDGKEVAGVTGWADLVAKTGAGLTWESTNQWGFPTNLALPARKDLEMAVGVNYFRAPPGKLSYSTKSIPNVPAGVFPDITETFIDGGAPSGPKGANITNETFVWSKDAQRAYQYDPTKLHTYTIVWTPTVAQFYIDAPNGGTAIEQAQPVKTMTIKDFPSTVPQGVNYPAGKLEFPFYGEPKKLDDLLIMLNVYPFDGWGGKPTFEPARTFIRQVAFYPLNADALTKETPLSSDFALAKPTLKADIDTWTATNWRYNLLKDFVIELSGVWDDVNSLAPSHYPELVRWADGTGAAGTDNYTPDGKPALRMSSRDRSVAPAQEYYYLALERNATKAATNWNLKAQVVDVDGNTQSTYAATSTYSNETVTPFWAPQKSKVKIRASQLDINTGAPTGVVNTCTITLSQADCMGCKSAQKNLTYSFNAADCTYPEAEFQFLSTAEAGATVNHGNSGKVTINKMTAVPPKPTIKASLVPAQGSTPAKVKLNLGLVANSYKGKTGEWFLLAFLNNGQLQWLAPDRTWKQSVEGTMGYVGPLADLANLEVEFAAPPPGTSYFYFGVDSSVNGGFLDFDTLFYAWDKVDI